MKYTTETELTLLEALQQMSPDSSKSTLRGWIKVGRILVDDAPCTTPNKLLPQGSTVSLARKRKMLPHSIEILYEDKDIVVIEKPEGLLSVATDTEERRTAHAILKEHYRPNRVYVVHRLDQDTSGVMMFALTPEALQTLKETFAAHDIQRCYTAIIEGKPEECSGTWDDPLVEDKNYYVQVAENGENAITHWEVVDATPRFARLTVTLETGKKNQIRVHSASAGHPIVGDAKYGATSNPCGRLGLHAHLLAFQHPTTRKAMRFESPLPQSFTRLFRHA